MSDTQNNQNSGDAIPESIKLKVVGQDGNALHFRVKSNTQMEKLKRRYSENVGAPLGTLRFLFDGRRVQDDDTPSQLEMENDDTIEVYHEQLGGNGILPANNNF